MLTFCGASYLRTVENMYPQSKRRDYRFAPYNGKKLLAARKVKGATAILQMLPDLDVDISGQDFGLDTMTLGDLLPSTMKVPDQRFEPEGREAWAGIMAERSTMSRGFFNDMGDHFTQGFWKPLGLADLLENDDTGPKANKRRRTH